jgi:hypothetical protein
MSDPKAISMGEMIDLLADRLVKAEEYIDTLLDWSARAAQELQEFLDAAREAGSDLPGVEMLIVELDNTIAIYAAPEPNPAMEDADGFYE